MDHFQGCKLSRIWGDFQTLMPTYEILRQVIIIFHYKLKISYIKALE